MPGRFGAFTMTLAGDRIGTIEEVSDATPEWLALPGLANLHAHADRAYTVQSSRPKSLDDALRAAAAARAAFTADDIRRRARQFFERSRAHGATRVRTHTDVDSIVEMRSLEGVIAARDPLAQSMDIDVIAFSTSRNDLSDPNAVARINDALAHGPDYIGASLNSSSDPGRALEALLDLAERSGLPVDLHIDEHLDPSRMLCAEVARAALARDLIGRFTFSHACVLGMLEPAILYDTIDVMARAGVTVVALPETNLFLQGRRSGTPILRGITLVHELASAGVPVRLGTDNVRDWFFPFGDGDLLDTALSAAIGLHLDDDRALVKALCDGRDGLRPGDAADLVLVRASSLDDALARRPGARVVFKAGRIVSGRL
jgi:cytosine deaminase